MQNIPAPVRSPDARGAALKQDQIRERFQAPVLGTRTMVIAEVAAQVSESNEYLKRIADALEQLVHRGVPK